MRHRLYNKKRKWPWILAAVVLIFGAFGVAGGKNSTQSNNLVGVPSTSTSTSNALPATTTTTTTTTNAYRFLQPSEVTTSTSTRITRNYGTPKPKPKPKPKSNNEKGHICLPGERDGDKDGKCGE